MTYDWEQWRADERAIVIDNSALSVDDAVARVEHEVARRFDAGN